MTEGIRKVLGFLNADVKNENESKTISVIVRCISVCLIGYFFISLFIFNGGITPVISILCMAGAAFSFVATYMEKTQEATIGANFVVLIWLIYSSHIYGWDSGVQMFFALLLLIGFLASYSDMKVKLAYAGLLIFLYIILSIVDRRRTVKIEVNSFLLALQQLINMMAVFGMIVVTVVAFSRNTLQMERKLKSYNEKLMVLASVDPLTQLKNRRCMMEYLQELVKEAEEKDDVFSIAIGDIDFFKKFNDHYGHECGDLVLKEVSKLFLDFMKERGEVARWGGEEFLFAFRGLDVNEARMQMEKLLHQVRIRDIEFADRILHITMTFGVSRYEKGRGLDSAISMADSKLYEGKESGRNRVI